MSRRSNNINALANVANLYYQRKTANALQQMQRENAITQRKQAQVADAQLRQIALQEQREKTRQLEERIRKAKLDLLFETHKDSKKVMTESISNLDKYIHLCGAIKTLETAEVTTTTSENIAEKREIQNMLDEINTFYDTALKSFSAQDTKDLDAVMKILEGDEEEGIQKHKKEIDSLNSLLDSLHRSNSISDHNWILGQKEKIASIDNLFTLVHQYAGKLYYYRKILSGVLSGNSTNDEMSNLIKEDLKRYPGFFSKDQSYQPVRRTLSEQQRRGQLIGGTFIACTIALSIGGLGASAWWLIIPIMLGSISRIRYVKLKKESYDDIRKFIMEQNRAEIFYLAIISTIVLSLYFFGVLLFTFNVR